MPGMVVGLDISLVGSAAVALNDDGCVARVMFFAPHRKLVERWQGLLYVTALLAQESPRGDQTAAWHRVVNVAEALLEFVASTHPLAVALEDHAFHAQGSSVYQLGWLHGLVRYGLNAGGLGWDGPVLPFRLYPPQSLKQLATGKGNAKKPEMIAAAEADGFQCRGYGEPKPAEDLADAYWCARLLHMERLVLSGRVRSDDLPESAGRILTKHGRNGVPILEQSFLQLSEES